MISAQAPTLAEGRYTLVRQIGEGGMATVFLGWDNKLKVWRAVKVLLPAVVRKRKLRKRFENEAHAMARVEHPNVVRVYDVGLEGNVPYMVMELAEGGCIIDWLGRYGAMPPRLAVDVTVQVCKGIRAAHEAGIVHRDVKPHNILVSRKGYCKVTDFGIAQMDSESLTKTGSVMGTWGYMAPEQRTDAKNVDERADVFSIGATLYSLLTNRTPTELYVAEPDDEVFHGIPPALLDVIVKACRYKPSERYEDVRSLGIAIHKAGTSQAKVPPSTPSLVLSAEPLPDSIDSAPMSPTIVSELRGALGVQQTTLPEDDDGATAGEGLTGEQKKRVLPYYMMSEPSTSGTPAAPQKEKAGRPSYIDASELEKSEKDHNWRLEPEPKSERTVENEQKLEIIEPRPGFSAMDWFVRLAILPVLLMIATVGLLGWGTYRVNNAHDQTNGKAQDMIRTIQQPGPLVDALARNGADRKALTDLYYQVDNVAPSTRGQAASSYIRAVEQAASQLPPSSRAPLESTLSSMVRSREAFESAQNVWRGSAEGFPGMLAVAIGLARSP